MPAVTDEDNPASPDKKGIRCARCCSIITSADYTASINTKHHHTFFNPAGIIFEIRCFHRAPGTREIGEISSEFSWFAGYSWQVALCRGCDLHMGWKFTGREPFFYGLIKGNLIGG